MNILLLLKPKCAVAYVNSKNTLRQGLEKMRHHGYKALPVIDDEGIYVGTVTEGDFLWYMIDRGGACDIHMQEDVYIRDIIKKDRTSHVKVDASMTELLHLCEEQNFAPVTDDRGVFVGMITRSDVIRYFENQYDGKESEKNEFIA